MLVRLDGAGFSHELLEHIAAGGGRRGRHWEFSVGWACTDAEMDAIARLPKRAWTAGIDQNGDILDDTFVADLTGLLDLDAWTARISGLRIGREEPLHPRYRKRATEREKQLGKRYQLVATSTRAGQLAWLDAATAPTSTSRTTSSRQGTGPEPVAVAALDDQRGLDPDRGSGREPARLLPPPRSAAGELREAARSCCGSGCCTYPPPDPRPAETLAAPARRLALDQ